MSFFIFIFIFLLLNYRPIPSFNKRLIIYNIKTRLPMLFKKKKSWKFTDFSMIKTQKLKIKIPQEYPDKSCI